MTPEQYREKIRRLKSDNARLRARIGEREAEISELRSLAYLTDKMVAAYKCERGARKNGHHESAARYRMECDAAARVISERLDQYDETVGISIAPKSIPQFPVRAHA